ncbi:methyltransferase domain-containing protein, partial [bacterium]|nr:methyltransferase domain-containing protein [bacterium]
MSQRSCPHCAGQKSLLLNKTDNFRIVRCRGCGLTYLENPPQETELYEKFWGEDDELPEAFAADAKEASLCEAYHISNQRVKFLEGLNPSGNLLDIGCGNGFFLSLAQQAGYECFGQEISQNAVRFARKNFNLNIFDKALDHIVQEQKMKFDIIT